MALYIPRSIFHLARLLYARPETFGPTTLVHAFLRVIVRMLDLHVRKYCHSLNILAN